MLWPDCLFVLDEMLMLQTHDAEAAASIPVSLKPLDNFISSVNLERATRRGFLIPKLAK